MDTRTTQETADAIKEIFGGLPKNGNVADCTFITGLANATAILAVAVSVDRLTAAVERQANAQERANFVRSAGGW